MLVTPLQSTDAATTALVDTVALAIVPPLIATKALAAIVADAIV